MSKYNFSTLNDKDFEELTRDLLNVKFHLQLQSFKPGKDKGVDLRYSTPQNNNDLVVQVKHYIGSKYSQFKSVLVNKELSKIKKLNPNRYIVVTSLPLSNQNKDEIRELLRPYVCDSNDVIGQEDLNAYLAEFKEIEAKNFKLWFSSAAVLSSILNNAIEGRTRFLLETIRGKMPYYVITQKLYDANKILGKEKLLLITGQPGIGKTTLAELLIFEKARSGFKIYKVENVREAEDVISVDLEERQLFYFDDFLGANYFEIINRGTSETQLTSFVERVRNTPNKYLLLTTRTVVLNQAINNYEKLNHSNLNTRQFEIKLTDYTKYEKALILYNHLYFRQVQADLLNTIIEDKFYKNIIEHTNYTPRIIDFITDVSKIQAFSTSEYRQFILNNLNNPKEIWRYSFINQIKYLDQCLLLTLFTCREQVKEDILREAFNKRLEFEVREHNQIINSNQFESSVKSLLNGFIVAYMSSSDRKNTHYSFINPSLTDFLIGFISESYAQKKSTIISTVFLEQLYEFSPKLTHQPLEKEIQEIIKGKIGREEYKVLETQLISSGNKYYMALIEALCIYCDDIDIDNLLLSFFRQLDFQNGFASIFKRLIYFLIGLKNAPLTKSYIEINFVSISEKILSFIDTLDEAKHLEQLFGLYGIDYTEFSDSDRGMEILMDTAVRIIKKTEEDLLDERRDSLEDMESVGDLYFEVSQAKSEIENLLFPDGIISLGIDISYDKEYWKSKTEENKDAIDAQYDPQEKSFYDKQRKLTMKNSQKLDDAIDNLFSKND